MVLYVCGVLKSLRGKVILVPGAASFEKLALDNFLTPLVLSLSIYSQIITLIYHIRTQLHSKQILMLNKCHFWIPVLT